MANHPVPIDCTTTIVSQLDIDYGDTVEFQNNCAEDRLIELFTRSNKARPVMFIQLQPGNSVIVIPGPDSDCHRTMCFFNIRIPNRLDTKRRRKILNGANKIIIHS